MELAMERLSSTNLIVEAISIWIFNQLSFTKFNIMRLRSIADLGENSEGEFIKHQLNSESSNDLNSKSYYQKLVQVNHTLK